MGRVVVVYNPRSSKAARVEQEVLAPLRAAKREFATYEVRKTDVDDNAKRLAKVLRDGDLVITAGGDGTATIGLNGVMATEKKVRMVALPYGNFNDMARISGRFNLEKALESRKVGKLYPLEMKIDGKHLRYAACYFTLGMFAESTEVFERAGTRKKLQKGKKALGFSILQLVSWWRENRRKQFLPRDLLATDILAVNGKTVARVMRGDVRLAFSRDGFIGSKQNLSTWPAILGFMIRSMVCRVPGNVAREMKLEFSKEFAVEIQAEGEFVRKKCRKIEITKAPKAVEVLLEK